jgi:transcriptional regulator of aromatic amino acid metabolism
MSLAAQVRLLRVLQDGEFTRVGGNEVLKLMYASLPRRTSILIRPSRMEHFAAISLPPGSQSFPIQLPALRERPEDIHLLVIPLS